MAALTPGLVPSAATPEASTSDLDRACRLAWTAEMVRDANFREPRGCLDFFKCDYFFDLLLRLGPDKDTIGPSKGPYKRNQGYF